MEFLLGLKCQFSKQSGPPDQIPAFATITTVLSCIERPRKHNSTTINTYRTDLKVLNALAKILARDHEVAAVVSKRDGSALVVVACVQRTMEPHIQSGGFQQLIPRWFIRRILQWLGTCPDENYDPTIVTPTPPPNMIASLEQYIVTGLL